MIKRLPMFDIIEFILFIYILNKIYIIYLLIVGLRKDSLNVFS